METGSDDSRITCRMIRLSLDVVILIIKSFLITYTSLDVSFSLSSQSLRNLLASQK